MDTVKEVNQSTLHASDDSTVNFYNSQQLQYEYAPCLSCVQSYDRWQQDSKKMKNQNPL